jgi:Predicted Fe-S oxidoreductases
MVQVEVTTKCNVACQYCVRTFDKQWVNKEMDLELFAGTVEKICKYEKGQEWLLQGTGEPLLALNLYKMMDIIHQNDPNSTISIITNGKLLNEDTLNNLVFHNLNSITLSIDDMYERYEEIRPGMKWVEIESVCELIKKYNKKRIQKISFGFSIVSMHQNLKHIIDVVRYGWENNIQFVSVMPLVIIDNGIGKKVNSLFQYSIEEITAEFEKIERFCEKKNIDISFPVIDLRTKINIMKKNRKIKCRFGISGIYINVDGKVAPCCMMSGSKVWGTINELDFNDMKEFREMWDGGKLPLYCEKCISSSSIIVEKGQCI